jgi:electron transport complex protein RnfG
MSGAVPPAGEPPKVSSFRLLATMGGGGAVAGFLIVLVYNFTLPTVQANRLARLDAAIRQVLPGAARYDTLYLLDGALRPTLPAGVDGKSLERVYAGMDASGRRIGYAIPWSEPGFQDAIDLIFGFDPAKPATLGLVVLASRETPGLGDKIESKPFLAQFADARTPLSPVKAGKSATPADVDMITGATISSRTVIGGINKAVQRWSPIITAYTAGGGS